MASKGWVYLLFSLANQDADPIGIGIYPTKEECFRGGAAWIMAHQPIEEAIAMCIAPEAIGEDLHKRIWWL